MENTQVKYANFWIRLAAAIIDIVILTPVAMLDAYNLLDIRSSSLIILLIVLRAVYQPIMELFFGATLGKMIMKIKVTDETYNPISLNQALLRWLAYFPYYFLLILSNLDILKQLGEIQLASLQELLDWKIANIQPTELEEYSQILMFVVAAFVILDNNTKRGLHDRIAKTFVIHTSTPKQ